MQNHEIMGLQPSKAWSVQGTWNFKQLQMDQMWSRSWRVIQPSHSVSHKTDKFDSQCMDQNYSFGIIQWKNPTKKAPLSQVQLQNVHFCLNTAFTGWRKRILCLFLLEKWSLQKHADVNNFLLIIFKLTKKFNEKESEREPRSCLYLPFFALLVSPHSGGTGECGIFLYIQDLASDLANSGRSWSWVVASFCCIRSGWPLVTPQQSGLDMDGQNGRPEAGFSFSQ